MPIYEYECAACGRTFEEMQKISAPPLKKCTLCGATHVRKLISQTSFQLKGTGWYVTDYARKDKSGNGKSGNGKSGNGKPGNGKGSKDAAPAAGEGKADTPKGAEAANSGPPEAGS